MSDNFKLNLYKASAGSGKTYTLTKEYIKLAMQGETKAKDILAITFTNAATADMKRKILENLRLISQNNYQSMDELSKDLGVDKSELPSKASKVLDYLLHNYVNFKLRTIDSFVQNTVRPFAFELGLPKDYETSIEKNDLRDEIVERLLAQTGKNGFEKHTQIILGLIKHLNDEQRSTNVKVKLQEIVDLIFKEISIEYLHELSALTEEDFLESIQKIHKYIEIIDKTLNDLSKKGFDLIESNNLTAKEFHGGKNGVFKLFTNKGLSAESICNPQTMVKTSLIKGLLKTGDEDLAAKLFSIYESMANQDFNTYFTGKNLLKTIYALAFINKAANLLYEVEADRNIVHVSEFNKKISEALISESSAFVYERTGEFNKHIFIDEFQDTSKLQWNNLLPLIENNLAEAKLNLVVGDAKQSLYRFREADMQQFVDLSESSSVKKIVLESNWRSNKGVITFNNRLYDFILDYAKSSSIEENSLYNRVERVYSEHKQYYKNETTEYIEVDDNNVEIYFRTKKSRRKSLDDDGGSAENWSAESDAKIEYAKIDGAKIEYAKIDGAKIEYVKKDGAKTDEVNTGENTAELSAEQWYFKNIYEIVLRHKLSDVAILCRWNKDAKSVAEYLLSKGISVITPDSLNIANNIYVKFILSCLNYLKNEDDFYRYAVIFYLYRLKIVDISLSLVEYIDNKALTIDRFNKLDDLAKDPIHIYDTVEALLRLFGLNKSTDYYILSFLDAVKSSNSSDVLDFLEWSDTNLDKLSLTAEEGANAVNIMSVHKSKGLEFKVVIYAFVNDDIKLHRDFYWAKGKGVNYFGLPVALLKYTKEIDNTEYAIDKATEKSMQFMDALNVMYVATTRARENLYILCDLDTAEMGSSRLNNILSNFALKYDIYKAEPKFTDIKKDVIPMKIENTPMISSDWRSGLEVVLSKYYTEKKEIKWGNFIHDILSEIETYDDLNSAINYVKPKYLQFNNRLEEVRETIEKIVLDNNLKNHFSAESIIKNEVSICLDGKLLRPDRISTYKDTTLVVDYKTGQKHESHIKQIKAYVSLLEDMKYKNVCASLVYINNSDVEVVMLDADI